MELVKHTKMIYQYKNFVTPEVCDKIIRMVESVPKDDTTMSKYSEVSKNLVRNNSAINITKSRMYTKDYVEVDSIVHDIFSRCNHQYITDNIFARLIIDHLTIKTFGSDYVYRYYTKDDYYDWHIDYDGTYTNVFSYILYLNDDFDGGSTLFLHDKLKVKPEKGSMLCFPCDFYTIHRATKVNNGHKKIVWSCFHIGKKLAD